MNEKFLWTERYRPKTLNDCILPTQLKTSLQNFIEQGEIPNLIFTGIQGSGKTSVARALAHELDAEVLVIDASSDNGKSMIENMIAPFANTISIGHSCKHKIVILDEADGLTMQAQQSLRPNIEKFSTHCRFIFTGNYDKKIIPAIKSRCVNFDFSAKKENRKELINQFGLKACTVLKENNIKFDVNSVLLFINKLFPDFRRVLNELQSYSSSNGEIDKDIMNFSSDNIASELFPIITEKKFDEAKKWVYETTYTVEDITNSLFKNMNDYVDLKKQPMMICILADYQYKSAFVANHQLNMLAAITEIMGNL